LEIRVRHSALKAILAVALVVHNRASNVSSTSTQRSTKTGASSTSGS